MQMKRRTLLAMAALCLSGIRAHAADESIVGVWSSETANSHGNHLQLVFTPSEVTLIVAGLTEGRYEIDGDKIAMGPVPQPGLPVLRPTPVPFSIDGAVLTITRAPAYSIVLMRLDEFQPDVHPIVGAWTYQHPAGVPAVLRFAPSGAMQTLLMSASDSGPYQVENGILTIQFNDGPAAVRIKREGNVLVATGSNGRPDRFVKFE